MKSNKDKISKIFPQWIGQREKNEPPQDLYILLKFGDT